MTTDRSSAGSSIDPETRELLLRRARGAGERAYAPYSHFRVGAALLAESGQVFTGCNVENASFSLTCCAERVAVGKAISEGESRFRAIAIVGPEESSPCFPCGSCRQVLWEFAPDLPVITPGGAGGEPIIRGLRDLLPAAFDNTALQGRSAPS